MPDFILLTHSDARAQEAVDDWEPYLEGLGARGALRGGSTIGEGIAIRRDGAPAPVSTHLTGFIRVEAASIGDIRNLLPGNPVYEAGGTIEIRELPVTD